MALGSLQNNANDAFVESSTRANKTAVETTVGSSVLPTGAATEQGQQDILAALTVLQSYTDNLESLLTFINSNTDGLEGFVDGLESLVTTSNTILTNINTNVDNLESYTDGLETLISSTNTLLTSIAGYVDQLEGYTDGIEGLLTSIRDNADQLEGYLDGVESKLDSLLTNATGLAKESKQDTQITHLSNISNSVDQLESYVDGLETLVTSTNTKLDTLITQTDAVEGSLSTIASNTNGVSTASNQVTGNNSLSTIVTNTNGLQLQTGANTFLDKVVTGTITLTTVDSNVEIECNGCSTVEASFIFSGTGTVSFEYLADSTSTWNAISGLPFVGTQAFAASTSASTTQRFSIAGATKFRARRTAGSSGSVAVHLKASNGVGIIWAISQNANNFLTGSSQVGAWTVQPGNTQNTTAWLVSTSDGFKTTYSAVASNYTTMATTPTDVFTLTGSNTKTVRILHITISGTQTSEATREIVLIKRSSANTGGSSTALTAVPHDSNNAAATATALAYSANPTLGTSVGNIYCRRTFISDATKPSALNMFEWKADTMSQAIVLRGTSQVLAVNFAGVTSSGSVLCFTIKWTEE